jgi:hypothetical protein
MIKYRYNMSVDPEPPGMRRVQVHSDPWSYETKDGETVIFGGPNGYLGDIWTRTSCKLKSGGFVYGRPNHLRVGRSHRSVSKRQWRRERDFNRTLCRRFDAEWDHIHWYNGDRHRPWGNFRGHTGTVIDLDSFSRMRTMYRRRKK